MILKGENMLDIYISETCPYCRKVMDFLAESGISYNKKDISNEKNKEKLLELGGKFQVPFLNDTKNSICMYESEDIINYLQNKV